MRFFIFSRIEKSVKHYQLALFLSERVGCTYEMNVRFEITIHLAYYQINPSLRYPPHRIL
jgi:hypothetical protein